MIEISFTYLIDGDYWPAMDLSPTDLLDCWLAAERLSCCTLQGGYTMTFDGVPWNHECIDELRMACSWLVGLRRLFDGAPEAQVWAWEESRMRLLRRREAVTMFDVHHSGHVVFPRVTVDLAALARALVPPTLLAAAQCDAVLAAAAARATPEQLQVLQDNLALPWREHTDALMQPPKPVTGEPSLSPLEEAILLDDRSAFAAAPDNRALFVAIEHGREWAVAPLLSAGADVNALDRQGMTPLLAAVMRRKKALVELLLAHGADPNARGRYQYSPLEQAALNKKHWDDDTLTPVLIAAGAK